MAPDHDLVAVRERAPLDPLAVDEHAVEAAVVEDAEAVGLAHDQRMTARHRGVVEPDVGREAAADPRPLALEREPEHVALAAGAVRDVLAGLLEPVAQLVEPRMIVLLRRQVDDGRLSCREQRRADELLATAVRTGRQLIDGVERHWIVAISATESPGPRNAPRHP